MRATVLALALGWHAVAASAAGFLPEKSEISFVSKQMGVELQGRFRKFEGDIVFRPGDLAGSKARIEVDIGSVDLGSAESEGEVKGKDWFQVANFPKAEFQATQIRAKGADHYEAVGKFTLKGITRDLVVPVSVKRSGSQSVAEGGFVLRRTDYNIGQGEWADPDTVALDVAVRFRFTLTEAAGK